MRKALFIIAVTAVASMASCKKDRTCVCTTTSGGSSASSSATINDTYKNAKATCEAKSSSIGSTSTTCKLK